MEKKTVLLVMALCGLWGCSLFRKSPPPYPQGPVFPMVKKAETRFSGDVFSPVRRRGGLLYFSARPDFIYAYDMEERRILWQSRTKVPLQGAPDLGEDSLYVVGEGAWLIRISLGGEELWRTQLSSPITSGILERAGQVIAGTETGRVTALDLETGEARWIFSAGGEVATNITAWRGGLLFGTEKGMVYALDREGRAVGSFQAEGAVGANLKVDGDLLFFGTESRRYYALKLRTMKKKWVRTLGGPVRIPAAVADEHLYVPCWDGVLYCLKKKTGNVDWWRALPSRSMFSPEIADDRVLASAQSARLVGFFDKNGESIGYFEADSEIRANPVWKPPEILIPLYDYAAGTGFLQHLEKAVTVKLSASLASPQKEGTTIDLSASAVGFFLAKYEFYIVSGEERTVLQPESRQNTYTWFPDKAGSYTLGVTVRDEREEGTAEIPYTVAPRETKSTDNKEKKAARPGD